MNLVLYAVLALAVMGMVGTGVYKVKQWGANEVRAEWNAANEKARKEEAAKASQAATNLESDNAKTKVVYKTITQTVDKYIDRPIYRNECFDADGLRDANSALVGTLTPPTGADKPVPGAKPSQ